MCSVPEMGTGCQSEGHLIVWVDRVLIEGAANKRLLCYFVNTVSKDYKLLIIEYRINYLQNELQFL